MTAPTAHGETNGRSEPEPPGDPGAVPASDPLEVVTVQAGSRYPDLYVERLRNMVARHLPLPHRFVVWADRLAGPSPRRFGADIEARDLSGWGLPGTRNKLRLFDPEVGGTRPFFFLDMTLVIRRSLLPLVERGRSTRASLVAVQDWNYPTLNSSVMWINPDPHSARVWESWLASGQYSWTKRGDQNYVNEIFRTASPEALTFWAKGQVVSYKTLRKRAVKDPAGALAAAERATILKFHGMPKPPDVLNLRAHPRSTVLRHPFRPRLWTFLADDIREHWR